MRHRKKAGVPSCRVLLLAGLPVVAVGAEPPVEVLEPLVVTGERSSGSDLTRDELDLFQVESVRALSGLVPGFYVVDSDSRGYGDIISMRGSANTLFFSPPAVGMMVDDVPMGDVFAYPSGLLEVDEVRILRGPQGTIYGRNGAAGMIEILTPRPGASNELLFAGEYGSYESFKANLRTGGPLAGDFSQTAQFYYQERDGFLYNSTLGRATDDRSLVGGLVNLYWNSTPDTEWRLRMLAERSDDGSQRLSSLGSPDPFTVESEIPGENRMERFQLSLHGTKVTDWGRMKSITSWQDWELDPSVTDLDLQASFPGFESSSTIIQSQRIWSQELRWESPGDAAPWNWRTGVFFMNLDSDGDATRAFPVEAAPGLWIPFSERTVYQTNEWNLAGYGRLSYALTPQWELSAGLRLEYVDSSIDRTKVDSFATASVVREDLGEWYLSPELGAAYDVCETTRVFGRSAIGIKPAGFSAFASIPALARYDEETDWTNEIGVEVALPEERLSFSLAGFWNLIHDYQLNQPDVFSTDYFTVNADRVTSLGLEGEARWQPVGGLTLQGSAGYVNATFDSYQNPLVPGASYDGNAVPFVPEFTGSLGGRYDFESGFYVETSARMAGATYFDAANSRAFRQGSYTSWDAEIGYAKDRFSVALFGRNLLDEEYYTFINPQINAGSPGDPQIFGVRLTAGF